jgi:hypothetical protein
MDKAVSFFFHKCVKGLDPHGFKPLNDCRNLSFNLTG